MSTLVPLYADAVSKGEFSLQWRAQAMPQVEVAQQQYVRYPFDSEAAPSAQGWARHKDVTAVNDRQNVRLQHVQAVADLQQSIRLWDAL